MMIAVDTSLVDYALIYALNSKNTDEVNFICNRIKDVVPQMQLALVLHSMQRISDWLAVNQENADYIKISPLRNLFDHLKTKRKEFRELE
jgi:hypothetical protein